MTRQMGYRRMVNTSSSVYVDGINDLVGQLAFRTHLLCLILTSRSK